MSEKDYLRGKGLGTLAIHSGQPSDPHSGAVIPPISLSTTFQQSSPGVFKGYEYSRSGNPTRNALEQNLASVEGGEYGLAFSSGLSATAALIHLLQPGDHVICADDVYGGTRRYFNRIISPLANIKFDFIDFNSDSLEKTLSDSTKMIWIETPTNPTLKLFNLKDISEKAHKKNPNILVVVDNTFMTAYFQKPLKLGVDIVLHSCSKYLNGHSDVIMGAVILNNKDVNDRLKFIQNGMGVVPSPFDCFLLMRGMKTLHVRMQRHEENAIKVADYLSKHSKVSKTVYPGLASHPQHELAKTQMTGFGGMITFYLKGGLAESRRFLESLKLLALAESLGGVESLIEHPAIMTHASVPEEARKELGIFDNMIRLSVGIEDLQDIISDLDAGFNAI